MLESTKLQADTPTLHLAAELIKRASVTPEDAGCQDLLAERLAALGFVVQHIPFAEVKNLWAKHGSGRPLLVFAGHTDVVPPGNVADWRYPPFAPTIDEGLLYGRGAADMKGSIAAFVTAVESFLAEHPQPKGSIALLLTSDEEGPRLNGTIKALETVTKAGEKIDWCLVGEPTSERTLADTIKVGRRGSLHGNLTVIGVQGHVAYPEKANNPIHQFAAALAELCNEHWGDADDFFPATSFQVSNIHAGVGATNVIPGSLNALFNFRFSTSSTPADLMRKVESVLAKHAINHEIKWELGSEPFFTSPAELSAAVRAAAQATVGHEPAVSTSGGSSDGRCFAPLGIQVVELGPINETIHKTDEHVSIADLELLSQIYQRTLENLLL